MSTAQVGQVGPAGAGAPVAARATVLLEAVAANTRLLARAAGHSGAETMAVVKADGFGHGAVDVARTALAHGATRLGVAGLGEAFALRAARVDAPLLAWLVGPEDDVSGAAARSIELAVPSTDHLEAVLARAPGASVHLQLDCGLAREGADPLAWPALCRAAARAERQGRLRVVGVMGHLACADQPGHPADAAGRRRFSWGVAVARRHGLRPRLRHLAATAATLHDPLSHHTLVRVGAGLVGIDPSGRTALRGALRLTAPVVGTRHVRAGTPVGYDHAWTAPRDGWLALVPLGYADGLPRVASGRAEVLVDGRRRPLVGRISMDQVVVDLGPRPVPLGTAVTLFGPGDDGEPTVAEWAAWSDTLPHEIVTGLGTRTPRTTLPAGTPLRSVR